MIVKFLKASATFRGVGYNFDKIAAGMAELLSVTNFGVLDALEEIRPSDYLHYLAALSARNKGISEPQLHVTISTAGRQHDKTELTNIAAAWMAKMGYGKQPYFVVFHRDTDNNHIHIVSTRIDHDGRKISSGFEHVRGIKVMNEIMGLDERQTAQKDLEKAMAYRFSTVAQFKLILERQGYTVKDDALIKFGKSLIKFDSEKVGLRTPDLHRATQLKAIVKKYAPRYDQPGFIDFLKTKMGVEVVLHSRDGKPAYGYTILDHAQKNAYRGSEIMSLKGLNEMLNTEGVSKTEVRHSKQQNRQTTIDFPYVSHSKINHPHFNISIANDVDDDQVHGPRRRRKKKARTNTR